MNPRTTPWRFAFAGFRHGHIRSLYQAAQKHPRIEVVGASESDPATAKALADEGAIRLTHSDLNTLLKEVNCDVIAVGDYYSARGAIAIAALSAGKHLISDKPICTSLKELEKIESLARSRKLCVGAQLDLRSSAAMRTMRRLILAGEIGTVHTINITAQHPLLLDSRPGWYFEEGKHGGTLNDIAIHAMDIVPWLTGRQLARINTARAWNARLPKVPHFQDAAQFMIQLDNGGGMLGDVSYLAPEKCGYGVPQYWRFTIHGSEGLIESTGDKRPIFLARNSDAAPVEVPLDAGAPEAPLVDFLDELDGSSSTTSLKTSDVLAASRQALILQLAADQDRRDVNLQTS